MKNEPPYITARGKVRLERDLLELETVKLKNSKKFLPQAAHGGDLETTHFRIVKIQPTKGKRHYATV